MGDDDNDEILKHTMKLCDNEYVLSNIEKRLQLGKNKYGHGVIALSDVSKWTQSKKDSWLEMASEEFYDGIVYLNAERIRRKKNNTLTNKEEEKLNLAIQLLASTISEFV